MSTNPVKLNDLMDTAPISSAEVTPAECEKFVRAVKSEMDRLGFTKANETTAASERLSERDFSVRINAR